MSHPSLGLSILRNLRTTSESRSEWLGANNWIVLHDLFPTFEVDKFLNVGPISWLPLLHGTQADLGVDEVHDINFLLTARLSLVHEINHVGPDGRLVSSP